MIRKYIQSICRRTLSEYFKDKLIANMPIGYDPLPKIRGGLYHWLYIPFNGTRIWCELRSLNANQIESCGDFALLQNIIKNPAKAARADIIRMRNAQEKLAIAVLNKPTYSEFEKMIYEKDNVIRDKRAELAAIKADFEISRKNLTPLQTALIKEQIDNLEFFLGYLLPEDTFGFLTQWALGADISEVKSLTRKKLLEAALLAKNANTSPSKYISGIFTDRDKSEIEKAAWIVYQEWAEENSKKRN